MAVKSLAANVAAFVCMTSNDRVLCTMRTGIFFFVAARVGFSSNTGPDGIRGRALRVLACAALLITSATRADELLFQDDFAGKLRKGWSWLRENPKTWRS